MRHRARDGRLYPDIEVPKQSLGPVALPRGFGYSGV